MVPCCAQDGATPMYIAARHGHAECIEALGRLRADVNKAATVCACVRVRVRVRALCALCGG